jgi:sarcosine oxidase
MAANYDVIIAGLGAMGSAAAFHLARSDLRVLALDRFAPPHSLGSSHGQTRIIREAYFEHPVYVPMVQRAYVLWHELQQLAGEPLLLQTGGLMIGQENGVVFGGAKRSAELHHLPHEVLSVSEIHRRFPALRPDQSMSGIWEPRAGILFPERCIAAHLALAARHGADLRYDEPVLSWSPVGSGVEVNTSKARYQAAQLVLSAGSWVQQLVPELNLPFTIERQVQFWFEPNASPALFHPEHCPIHLWEYDQRRFFYGFPDLGDGVKVACHHHGETTSPEAIRREVSADEVEAMRAVVRRFLPTGDGPLRSAVVCMYTNTPDEHFWIDRHPNCPGVFIASPCSGHGFKFSSVIGEILRDLVIEGKSAFDLDLFRSRASVVKAG